MLERAAERVWRVTSRLMAVEPVFTSLQRTLSFTLSARQVLDRVLETVWAASNVPSSSDLERLEAELSEARETVAALEARLQALAEALERAPR